MRGTTASGFEFSIDKEVLNDWAVLDYLGELADGYLLHLPKFTKLVLGDEQAKALVEHCKKDGKAIPMDVATEVFEIINQLGDDGKN